MEALKVSIGEIGLRTPLTVVSQADGDDTRMILVAGLHRLEALRDLGEEFVDCFVLSEGSGDAELWEIDENLARGELTDAQRADHHSRRKIILEARGLAQSNGGDRRSDERKAHLKSYADQASQAFGAHPATVRKDVRRGDKISPDVLADVSGSPLDKGVVLDELAATPKPEQPAKLEQIRREREAPRVVLVKPAADPLNDPEAHEKQLAALMAAWNRSAAVVRAEFLLRIEEPVFDRGAAA